MSTSQPEIKATVVSKVWDVLSGQRIVSNTDRVRFGIGWVGSIFAIFTAAILAWRGFPTQHQDLKEVALPFLLIWTIAPPMYFWFDYYVLWYVEGLNGNRQFATLEEFKHGQELSRNLWLAIVALLAAVYFH